MGRLRTVTKDGTLVEEYQYGLNGSRTSEINTLKGITTPKTYAYSDEDHLLTVGDVTYQYDADGFLVIKTKGTEVTEYAYSSRGELLQVNLPDGKVIEYLHDPLGRRVAKVVNGTITEKYLWGGLTTLLAVYDGSNNLLMRFEYADDRMPVLMTKGAATYYLAYDQIGTLRVISDASGNVVKKIAYDSFGNIINDTNPGFQVPFTFAGGLHDRDTDLIRFGARDYDPDTGRWTAKDPILFASRDTDLYGYCLNDPVNLLDPDGLDSSPQACNEKKDDCVQKCLDDYYGPWLAVTDALGVVSLSGVLEHSALESGVKGGEKAALKGAEKTLETSGSKGFAYIKGLPQALQLRQVASGLSAASWISWPTFVGCSTFSLTARAYCYFSCQ